MLMITRSQVGSRPFRFGAAPGSRGFVGVTVFGVGCIVGPGGLTTAAAMRVSGWESVDDY
jgi:hypothetical protein